MKEQNLQKTYKIILLIMLFFTSIYLIYNILLLKNIENILRFIVILFVITVLIICVYIIKKNNINMKKSVVFAFYSVLLMIGSTTIKNLYSKIDKMSVSYNIKTMSIVKLRNKEITDKITLGTITGDFDIVKELNNSLNINAQILIKESYSELINSLYNEELNYIYLPSTYLESMSSIDTYSNIMDDTEIVYNNYEKEKVEIPNIDVTKTPFTLLVMGVDSSENSMINSSFNGDALLLFTFNPSTLSATILSIPRDTYTSITCFDGERKNKITHAAWYGESCMMDTIGKLFDINIDYFVKINFKGFVSLIDLLGGIDIDVPISFCEQDSNRSFENQICLNEGYQHLTGEQALALARHRKTINDFIRGDNQKIIIEALLQKVKTVKDVQVLYSILDTISNNLVTNINTDDILSLYNIAKKSSELKINKIKLDGYGEYIYDYSTINNQGMKMLLYNFIPYIESLDNIKNIMKQNLNGEEMIENDIDSSSSNLVLLPDFTGRSQSEVESFCNKYNINLKINEVISYNSNDYEGKVMNQDLPPSIDVDYVNALTIDVVSKVDENIIKNKNINCSKEESKDLESCKVPDFTGKDYDEFKIWFQKNNYSFRVVEDKISKNSKKYDDSLKGKIIKQNYTDISIFDIIGKTLKITYMEN